MEETWNGRFIKVHKTICQGGSYSPYFDYSDGFMAVQVGRNLTNCALYPEGWYGEGGGRRVQDGEHMYTCGRFILIFGKTNTIM